MSAVQELTDADFQETVEKADVPVLVDFSATWCQPCKALAPVIDAVAKEYEGKMLVTKVDIDQARQTAIRFGIQGVPTCIFFKSGAEVDRFMGNMDLKEVKARVERVLG
jgi:thioredoxin 1